MQATDDDRDAELSEALSSRQAMRERQKVLLCAVPVILIFGITDFLLLGGFSAWALFVRVLWAASAGAVAFLLPRAAGPARTLLGIFLGASTSAFFTTLVFLTGGHSSPMFHFVLAMPLIVAVVMQDQPSATIAASIAMLLGGLALLTAAGREWPTVIEWSVQAIGMALLAVYASHAYFRLRARERSAIVESIQERHRALSWRDAVKARDEFLSIVAHELKTPLTTLVLRVDYASSAATAAQREERFQSALDAIGRQTHHLSALVERLLDVSRLDNNLRRLELEEIDLGAFLRDLAVRFEGELTRGECELELDVGAAGSGVWDRIALEQVVTNLLTNAIKFGPGKPISIWVAGDAETATIYVRDRGIGIAEVDRARIFGRFERAVSSSHYGGLGLGLWIAQRIISAMGGELTVESEVGRGSTLAIRLPRGLEGRNEAAAS